MDRMRSNYYDNLKGILTILVVFGHVVSPVQNDGILFFEYIFKFIYTFHMPIFVFVSGLLSKSDVNIKALFSKLLFPLICFQIIYTMEEYFINKASFNVKALLLEPFSILWYLLSLFTWRILIKIPFARKSIYMLLVASVASLLAGTISRINLQFSLSRTIVFFPFFYLGYLFNEFKVDELICFFHRKRYLAIVALLVFFTIFWYAGFWEYSKKMYWGALPYKWLKISNLKGVEFRVLVFLISLSVLTIIISFVKNSTSFLTKIGKQSLQIYLFHFLFIRVLFALGFYNINLVYQYKILTYIILSFIIVKCSMLQFFTLFIDRVITFGILIVNKVAK